MDIQTEKQLIERAKNDPEAFGQLFESYYPKLFNFCLRKTGHPQNAQDIASESFYKAFKKLHSFNWRGFSFGAWLYKIASNEIANLGRRKNFLSLDHIRATTALDVKDEQDIQRELEEAELQIMSDKKLAQLLKELEALDKTHREALELFYLAELSINEIANITGAKEGTVKARLSRGREKLKKALQPLTSSSVVNIDR